MSPSFPEARVPSRPPRNPDQQHHDVVIVGARAAGASAALLLARAGVDVLVVDRSRYGSDTLSSHALMSGAVQHLARWELLDKIADVTPAIARAVFEFGDEQMVVETAPDLPLYAPRRTVLDPILVDAARDAGATFRFGTGVVDVHQSPNGRATGIEIEPRGGRRQSISCELLVGADGLRSFVARLVAAPVTHRGTSSLASIYAYVRGADLPAHDYRFAYRDGAVTGSIPTNDDLHCVFVSMAPHHFKSEAQLDVAAALQQTMARVSPTVADGARAGTIVGPIRSFPGHHGQFRSAHGPGWALVGDAGYFKDPAAAHGLSDAFRDAELLTEAILSNRLDTFGHVRDSLSMPLFNHIERLTSLDWDAAGSRQILIDIAMAMAAETHALEEHLGRTVTTDG